MNIPALFRLKQRTKNQGDNIYTGCNVQRDKKTSSRCLALSQEHTGQSESEGCRDDFLRRWLQGYFHVPLRWNLRHVVAHVDGGRGEDLTSPLLVLLQTDTRNILTFETFVHLYVKLKMKLKVKKRHCWRKCMIVIES